MNFYEEQIDAITVNDLFYKLQLYKKVRVNWKAIETREITERNDYGEFTLGYDVYPSKEVKTLIALLFSNYLLYGYCPKCKKSTGMNTYKNENPEVFPIDKKIWGYAEDAWDYDDFQDLTEIRMKEELEKICKNGGFHEKYFTCPICKEAFRISLKIELNEQDELIIRKVGQFPTIRDFNDRHTNRFEKVLKKRKLKNEYVEAISTHDEGHNIAAYVYLRRIVEKLILQIFEEKERDITLEEFCIKHFEDKTKYLKDDLPELLRDKRIYDITSAGVHKLSDEECEEYYPILLDAFELILIEEEKKIKEKGIKESLNKELGNVHSEVKKKVK